jgi:ABC-2 type transport system permease protein
MMSLAGMLIGLFCEKWDHLAAAFVFVLTPLTFLSGVFAPVDKLPDAVAFAVRFNPIFHAIEGFRYGFLGSGPSGAVPADPLVSLAVVAGTVVFLWACNGVLIHRGYKLKP